MSVLDAEQLEAVHAAVRIELAKLLGINRPPDLPGRPALHEAAPLRGHALGPLRAGYCTAVVYDGSIFARCAHRASTTREGRVCCGQHARVERPRWANGDGYTGI
jgi:hypothetical protein